MLEALARERPNDAQVQLSLASAYAADKSYDKARRLYSALLSPVWKGKADSAEVHRRLGQTWQAEGKPAEAREEYRRAFHDKPSDVAPLIDLAQTYLSANDAVAALAVYNDALGGNPPCWAEIRLEIALVEMERKDYKAAADQCALVVAKKPEMVRARIALAEALEGSGDKPGALVQHREILKLSPNQGFSQIAVAADAASAGKPESAEKLFLSGLANTLAEQERIAEGVIREVQSGGGSLDFQRLIAIAQKSKRYDDAASAALNGLTSLASHRPERWTPIIAALDNLSRRFPRSRLVADRLIECYESRQASAKAEGIYKRLLGATPKDAGLWTKYGGFLEKHSRTAEALKAYRKALEIDPKNTTAADRIRTIETHGQ